MRPRALIAPARRPAALRHELWDQAVSTRREWLDVGLSTEPADHDTSEEIIASLYARHGRPRPEFVRVPSPRAAIPYVEGMPTHEDLRAWLTDRRPPGRFPLAGDIAAGLSRLRSALEAEFTEPPPDRTPMKRRKGEAWPVLPPGQALDAGLPFQELLVQGVRTALFRSLSGIYRPIRAALGQAMGAVPIAWYGQGDAFWVAHIDAVRPRTERVGPFAEWSALTRSAGWWWPGEHRCVLVDRPVILRTEPVPGAWHEEVRPVHIEYADGWAVPF